VLLQRTLCELSFSPERGETYHAIVLAGDDGGGHAGDHREQRVDVRHVHVLLPARHLVQRAVPPLHPQRRLVQL